MQMRADALNTFGTGGSQTTNTSGVATVGSWTLSATAGSNTLSASFNFLRWLSPNGIQTNIASTTGAAIGSNGDDSVRVRNGRGTWTAAVLRYYVSRKGRAIKGQRTRPR